MYGAYILIDASCKMYTAPKIYPITEYDLHNMLLNSSITNDSICLLNHTHSSLEHVMIERNTNYGTFIMNQTTCSHYASYKNIQHITKIVHYGLVLPHGDVSSILDRIINDSDIKIEYYDKQTTLFDMFSIKSITYYFVIFVLIRFFFSYLSTDISHVNKMGDDMCMITDNVQTRFCDIVGMIEAKVQIQKYVDIMKNREKYMNIGATIPKGVLLSGPPGCGKTLLAKAVAGESGVKIIAVCGSDFDEVFVGVGSSRVKKLFELARTIAPCIIFIDEIDSIGEKRNMRTHYSTDTLNKILSEMDGFKSSDNIMVIAATNRDTVLDDALLRSGRFDSKIYIDPPNRKERCELYNLYLKKIKIDEKICIDDFVNVLSKLSPDATGADVANICNHAAINAVANDRKYVEDTDVYKAIDDVLIGIEKKSKQSEMDELTVTAYHEAGHALIGYILKYAMPPLKLSIIPRGHGIAGYTLPQESEAQNKSKEQLIATVYGLLGGRCAEMLKFGKATTGASNDFEKATKLIENMITKYSMYPEFTLAILDMKRDSPYCVSDNMRNEIEKLIHSELENIYKKVLSLLDKYSNELEQLALKLLEDEVIDYSQIKLMFPDIEDITSVYNQS